MKSSLWITRMGHSKPRPGSPFAGLWRIVPEQDCIDEGEGYFEFGPHHDGTFQFGCVQGQMTCRPASGDGAAGVEWTWEGHDGMGPMLGRGRAVVKGEELQGTILFHGGDEIEFLARKEA